MALKYNPITGKYDLTIAPGGGSVTSDFLADSGSAVPNASGEITFTGVNGITTSATGNTVTLEHTGGGFGWTEVTGTSQAMSVGNAYIANNASLVTLTLPATSSIGDSVQVIGKGAGLFRIAQNAGQTIHYVDMDTTSGAGGSITSIEQYGTIEMVCTAANTDWTVNDSTGTFTLV